MRILILIYITRDHLIIFFSSISSKYCSIFRFAARFVNLQKFDQFENRTTIGKIKKYKFRPYFTMPEKDQLSHFRSFTRLIKNLYILQCSNAHNVLNSVVSRGTVGTRGSPLRRQGSAGFPCLSQVVRNTTIKATKERFNMPL